MNVKAEVDYGSYNARTVDAYECQVLGYGAGWFSGWAMTHRAYGGEFAGYRSATESVWQNVQFQDVSGSFSVGILGIDNDPYHEAKFWLAHDRRGPSVDSELAVSDPSAPLDVQKQGRFWCLSGVSGYPEGTYRATSQSVSAQNLAWQEEMSAGILVRLRVDAQRAQWTLEAPDGTVYPSPDGPDSSGDWTFCSFQPGHWTLRVNELESLVNTNWELTALVFDTNTTVIPCMDSWQISPLWDSNIWDPSKGAIIDASRDLPSS